MIRATFSRPAASAARTFSTFRTLQNSTTSSSPVPESPATQSSPSSAERQPLEPLTLFPNLSTISQADLVLTTATPGVGGGWYRVTRTKGNQLPVYADVRANGHRTTIIRRIEGSPVLLKADLKEALGLRKEDIKIKPTSGQIKIKGDHVRSVKHLLSATF